MTEKATTETRPVAGQIWEDTFTMPKEWLTVLHVGSDHVLVQRNNGVGRYPLPDFGAERRFQYIITEVEP